MWRKLSDFNHPTAIPHLTIDSLNSKYDGGATTLHPSVPLSTQGSVDLFLCSSLQSRPRGSEKKVPRVCLLLDFLFLFGWKKGGLRFFSLFTVCYLARWSYLWVEKGDGCRYELLSGAGCDCNRRVVQQWWWVDGGLIVGVCVCFWIDQWKVKICF